MIQRRTSITWDLGKHTAGDKGTVTFKVNAALDCKQ